MTIVKHYPPVSYNEKLSTIQTYTPLLYPQIHCSFWELDYFEQPVNKLEMNLLIWKYNHCKKQTKI